MADPFLGEIRVFSFNFPPKGWAFCAGQFLPINQNQGLFALLGTMYGGNGQTNFALPNLSGRVPVHAGLSFTQGQVMGEDVHTVNVNELPAHTHQLPTATGVGMADGASLAGRAPAAATKQAYLAPLQAPLTLLPMTSTGGSQPHENRMPSLVLSFCIALQGIFPSQT